MYESTSRGDNAAGTELAADVEPTAVTETLIERVAALLGGGRTALITDIDGTISPIVARPEDAFVLPDARRALLGLRDVLDVVGVVTGRAVADARAMVGVDGIVYVGNHGLEVWGQRGPELLPEARPWVPMLARVLEDVVRHLTPQASQGVIFENKGATASVHYRLAPDSTETRRRLLEILVECAVPGGLRIEEGRMVINLLPPLTVSKGTAITWLAREHHLNRLVFIGDDMTDAHAFRALDVLRQTPGTLTLSIGVVGPETPLTVRELADATVPTVAAVAELLVGVLDWLKTSATMEARAPSVGST